MVVISSSAPVFSDVTQLLWLLLIPVALILAGILWLSLVRVMARRQSTAAARRAAELEAWYRDLFDNAHDILLSLDLQGGVRSLNRAGRALLGHPSDQEMGRSMVEWIAPDHRHLFEDMLQKLRQGQDMVHGEITLVPSPDRRVVWRLNLRRQTLPGRPVEFRGVAWDVTAQRQAQDALRESEHRLRHSLEERIRIGRDLHDGIIQSIYAVGLALGEIRHLVETQPQQAQQRLEGAARDLNAVIRDVRAFIEGLEPEALKGREFRTALESVADQLSAPQRVNWSLHVDPAAANALSANQAAGLLHIAREALSNALRHSQARQVSASLTCKSARSEIHFELKDDGCGFDLKTLSGRGLGLRNLEARATELGAQIRLDSGPGRGTSVRVTFAASGTPKATPAIEARG